MVQETYFWSPGQENPLEKEMAAHSRDFLGNPTDRRELWATVPGVTKELDMTQQSNTVFIKDLF